MAAKAYHKPDNVEILDMHRGVDTSRVRFAPEGCCIGTKPDPGLMTALRFYARKEIKEQWRAAGIRVEHHLPREVNQAAEQYLSEHWRDLLPQAQQLVDRVSSKKGHKSNRSTKAKAENNG
jgi:hypothetical protein